MRVVDLELALRSQGAGYMAEVRLTQPDGRAAALLAADVPVGIAPEALLDLLPDGESYGRALTGQLFADARLGEVWQRARDVANGAGLPLRLRLRLPPDAEGLHAVRWETLRDPRTDAPLACDERLRLVRYLESDDTRQIPLGPRPSLRALLIVASPRDLRGYGLAEIDVAAEVGRVREALAGIKLTIIGNHEEAESRRVTIGAIRAALQAGPTIVCLICHGQDAGDDTALWLEDERGQTAIVDGAMVTELVAQLARPPLLAVLVACESGGSGNHDSALAALGPRLALAGIGAVVAMQAKLSMTAASSLLPTLFRALAHDGTIDRAVSTGRAALRDGDEWWTPALWLRVRDGRLWEERAGESHDHAPVYVPAIPLDVLPPVASLPPGSRMPFARGRQFTGREEQLLGIARAFINEAAASIPTVAITGIGGVGKTSLAIEFVHRYGQCFPGGVFWVSCAAADTIPGEVAACGARGLIVRADWGELSQGEQERLVLNAWHEPTPRLLVFDTCEDEELLQKWRPTSGGGHVLITTRRAIWRSGTGVMARPLHSLPRAESLRLLTSYRGDLAAYPDALDGIAAVEGDLPLALHLAGSYLETYAQSMSLGDPNRFLAELRQVQIVDHEAMRGVDGGPSLERTFRLSYTRLAPETEVGALARSLLARAARVAPGEPFTRELLLEALAPMLAAPLESRAAEQALIQLIQLGLLEPTDAGGLIIHPVIAAWVLRVADDESAELAIEGVICRVAQVLVDAGLVAEMEPLRAHLFHVATRAGGRRDVQAAVLAGVLGTYLFQLGRYQGAQGWYAYALPLSEDLRGADHPETITLLNNLGNVARVSGDYLHARALYQEARERAKRGLGDEGDLLIAILSNLAGVICMGGDLAEADRLYMKALRQAEQCFGPASVQAAHCLNNLAHLRSVQGAYAEAQELYARALEIRERELGPEHLQTANNLSNLAGALKAQGRHDAARPLLERALAIWQERLGLDHPTTAGALSNLAWLLEHFGDLEAAHRFYRQALEIYDGVFGDDHPESVGALNNLAGLLDRRGDHAEALALYERALVILEGLSSPDPIELALVLNNYAVALADQQRFPQAIEAIQRALTIRERTLPPGHHHIDQSRRSLARITREAQEHTSFDSLPDALRAAILVGDHSEDHKLSHLDHRQIGIALTRAAIGEVIPIPVAPPEMLEMTALTALEDGSGEDARAQVLAALKEHGWNLAVPLRQIWAGERDAAALMEGQGPEERALIQQTLTVLAAYEDGRRETPDAMFAVLPASVQRALTTEDADALGAALKALPAAEVDAALRRLEGLGVLISRWEVVRIVEQYESSLQAIAMVAVGDTLARVQAEQGLAELAVCELDLSQPVQAIWEGARGEDVFGLAGGGMGAQMLERILELVADYEQGRRETIGQVLAATPPVLREAYASRDAAALNAALAALLPDVRAPIMARLVEAGAISPATRIQAEAILQQVFAAIDHMRRYGEAAQRVALAQHIVAFAQELQQLVPGEGVFQRLALRLQNLAQELD